jgi:hypothetical protein
MDMVQVAAAAAAVARPSPRSLGASSMPVTSVKRTPTDSEATAALGPQRLAVGDCKQGAPPTPPAAPAP